MVGTQVSSNEDKGQEEGAPEAALRQERMIVEQFFLFTDEELGIEKDAEIDVESHVFVKAKKRKELAREKNSRAKKKPQVLDDEILSVSVKPVGTREDRLAIEEEYGVPERFLCEMEAGCPSDLDHLMSHPLLKKDEERKLLSAYCRTRENPALEWLSGRTKKILISRNMRLVGNIVQKRFTNYIGQGVEKCDLVQYGVEGLGRAVEKFDMSKDCVLSTYATRWISQAIQRSLDNESDMIRNPVHYHNFKGRITRAEEDYIMETSTLGRPSEEYICKKTKIKPNMLKCVLESATCACSIDAPIDSHDEDSSDFQSAMADETQDVEELAIGSIRKKAILEAIQSLPPTQAFIIQYRFGFKNKNCSSREEATYKNIAADLGISDAEVKEAETKALSALRDLLAFLDNAAY